MILGSKDWNLFLSLSEEGVQVFIQSVLSLMLLRTVAFQIMQLVNSYHSKVLLLFRSISLKSFIRHLTIFTFRFRRSPCQDTRCYLTTFMNQSRLREFLRSWNQTLRTLMVNLSKLRVRSARSSSSSSRMRLRLERGEQTAVDCSNLLMLLILFIPNFISQSLFDMPKTDFKHKSRSTHRPDEYKTSMNHDKSLGQHLLVNHHILHAIVEKAAVKDSDVVLEVGPGTGNLTQLLLSQSKRVIAIERDPRMIAQITKRFKFGQYQRKLQIIPGDVIKTPIPYFDVCVANLPYQISSPFVFKLLAHRPLFKYAVLMFQKEFADRLVAKAGSKNYSRLSVNVQLMAKVQFLMKVGKNNFKPPPDVQSAVVRIQPKNPLPKINYVEWDVFLRICFTRKNKTLRACFTKKKLLNQLLKNENICQDEEDDLQPPNHKIQQNSDQQSQQGIQYLKARVEQALGEWRGRRGIELSVQDFLQVLASFNEKGIHFK